MAKTLLLVDDSVTIQRVVELSFAHEDVRIVSMSDGQRALQWLEVDKPDIVVVDVGVPEVDGYTVATRVKNAKRTRDVPVLLLAGAFEPVDDKRVRDIGCDGVIVKPFEPKQLVERVKELIDLKPIKTARPAPAPVHGAPPAMSAAAAAVANPPALRAVRSMPPPAPEPEPVPVPEPEPVMASAVVSSPAQAAPAAPMTWAASGTPSPIDSDVRVAAAAETRRLEPLPTTPPEPVMVSPAATPTVVEPAPAPVAVSKAPQPLELPSRPMWSGGATPPVAPPGPAGASLSAPQASAKAALVNAFSALLAVDQPPAPPAPPPPPAAPTVAVLSENMVEAAVRRVLEQMTEEQVRRIVAETADRLVREEIDRITASSEDTGS